MKEKGIALSLLLFTSLFVARAAETDDGVVFSVTRGLHDTAFDFELLTADGDAKIYDTTDDAAL